MFSQSMFDYACYKFLYGQQDLAILLEWFIRGKSNIPAGLLAFYAKPGRRRNMLTGFPLSRVSSTVRKPYRNALTPDTPQESYIKSGKLSRTGRADRQGKCGNRLI